MANVTGLTASWSAAVTALSTDEVWQVRGHGEIEIDTDASGFGVKLIAGNNRADAIQLPAGSTPRYRLLTAGSGVVLTRTPV